MPTYEFRCPNGHTFDQFHKISDAPSEASCPICGARAERAISGGAGLVFKGSGFYLTDYGKNAHRGGSGPAKPDGGKSEGGESSSKSSSGKTAGGETKSGGGEGGGASGGTSGTGSGGGSTGGSSGSSSSGGTGGSSGGSTGGSTGGAAGGAS